MRQDEESVEDVLENISLFLKAFEVDESDIGIVLSPAYENVDGRPRLDYFVKAYTDLNPCLDGSVYIEEGFSEDVYTGWVEEFESGFPEADVAAASFEDLEHLMQGSL
ncbi:hypothetical protein [Candidatus Nanohalovita haloferacivicina]|uniref:hypothetical protein n=1 Tax=Candidatus Nanohalovita haloferacivicina TaxID=2978046 RepID=UPI00325FDBEC|nr:hypothetical protein HBNXNv_0975 [Candidatus Nanohalobia archaeon BNXNv]